jgi:ketosteroid isomerase-like protein
VGKSGPSIKSADAAPVLPPAEAAKPLSVSVAAPSTQPQKSAESPKNAAEEKKPVPPVKKPGAASLNALSVASPQRDSIAVKPPKPAAPRTAAVAKASSSSQLPEPAKGTFGAFGIEDEPEAGSKWLKWSAWVAALIVLVIAPLVWLYMPSHPESAAPVSRPAPAAAAPAPAPQPPVLARQAGDDPDPAMVVSDWEAAMNSRDAAAQAAFYADPVDRYFLRHNLSRDEVKADKQSAINRRKGDWSVEMENVKVTRPDDNTARVRLIKHYTVKEEGKTASEWFVPSLLLMTRANGRWQITSERDLGWATSMEELGN